MANRIITTAGSEMFRKRTKNAGAAEFSGRAVILGAFLGIVFGLVTVYIALEVGLNFSASIPISVLSITRFRADNREKAVPGSCTRLPRRLIPRAIDGAVFPKQLQTSREQASLDGKAWAEMEWCGVYGRLGFFPRVVVV